ncbi:very short patch repair endonuclease [Fontisphaera persica]|uniref:very short patch repair endonuclease n=1 Tax=Fontisphaera persica TaxID=2974023 RepID=UPI0024BFE458|nr:very short patch repair endonuclease [Fontisphaera persica]WCJ58255.1 very short patch repair endonuclease [Fontisphaera persica]
MSRIRSCENATTEIRLIQLFRIHKIKGWRRNQRLPGKPDFVFPKSRLAVFVDGCFWHGCPRCYRRPLSNQQYWDAKILRNRQRDVDVKRCLKNSAGVLFVFGHTSLRSQRARLLAFVCILSRLWGAFLLHAPRLKAVKNVMFVL